MNRATKTPAAPTTTGTGTTESVDQTAQPSAPPTALDLAAVRIQAEAEIQADREVAAANLKNVQRIARAAAEIEASVQRMNQDTNQDTNQGTISEAPKKGFEIPFGVKVIATYAGALFMGIFAIGAASAASDKVFGTNMRNPQAGRSNVDHDNSASA